jgi:hypothetical protein
MNHKIKSFLALEIIWKDEHIIELGVTASNAIFQGKTEVYDQPESLLTFAEALKGVPLPNQTLFYEKGKKDDYAYFSMKFYPIDTGGHVGVEINLESNVATEFRPEEKNKVKLEIIIEPAAIDNFIQELNHLAQKQEGRAILYGSDNRR